MKEKRLHLADCVKEAKTAESKKQIANKDKNQN